MCYRKTSNPRAEAELRRAQRRHAKQYVFRLAFNDSLRGEAVNKLEPEQIRQYLASTYSEIYVGVHQFTRGEAIADNKGKSTLQQ